tara:strand:- start:240 stop:2078 length:1839 start_codon:yes stop_codon:yes gene_type:complete
MAIKDANIGVLIGGDASGLQKELKKASGSLDTFGKDTRKAINKLGKVGAAAAAAGAAIAGALFKATVDTAAELDNLSRVANTNVETFQTMAAGAKLYGVEQDKLADILKDTSDKVGDFLATGGGAMADYFENVAPLVGQTAEEFKNLSGDQALQKYVDGLEAANLSQSEMTFYMEAIASDATNLLPLLADNGKELERMGDAVDKFGGALNEVEVEQLKEVKRSMTESSIVMKNLINKIMAKFAPVITAISKKFTEMSDSSFEFGDIATKVFDAVAKAAGYVGNAVRGIQVIVKGLELAFVGFKSLVINIFSGIIDVFEAVKTKMFEVINSMIDGMNKIPKVNIENIIVGQSEASAAMSMWADDTIDDIQRVKGELHDLAMQELPSESITNWMQDVKKSADESTAAIIEARKNAVRPNEEVTALQEEDKTNYRAYLEEKFSAQQQIQDKTIQTHKEALEVQQQAEMKRFNGTLQGFSGFFKNLSSLMDTENKKQFKLGKAAAIAGAVIDGISAGIGAYKTGAKIGGPVLGAAFAGASALATGTMISNLKGASFNGGGSSSAPAAQAPAAPPPPVQQDSTFTVSGLNPDSIFSGEQVAGLLLDYQRNGGRLILE